VEARLALGLASRDAFAPHLRTALRTALIPAVDSTKVVGLISLPGATVGLLLAGVNPLTAIRYQVVVMYMLLGAAAVAGVVAGRLGLRSMFDDAHRLRT
jgi:putative ABC transport system permease protein